MTSALINYVRALGGEGGAFAIGYPGGPSLSGISAVTEDGARTLAEAARTDGLHDPSSLARLTGFEPEDLARRTALVIAGRDAGWQFPDLLDVLPFLARAVARVVVVTRPASIASSPHVLSDLLGARGFRPLLTGITPKTDPVTPGSPIAIIERPVPVAPVTVGAIIHSDNPSDLDRATYSIQHLGSQGVSIAVIDSGGGGVAEAVAHMAGVVSATAVPTEDLARLAPRIAADMATDWAVEVSPGDRLRSPFPDATLPETIALQAALGANLVKATIVEASQPLDGHEPGLGFWRFAHHPDAFGQIVAGSSAAAAPLRVSPYNLLLERLTPSLDPDFRGVTHEPLALLEERGASLIERLSGFGVFDLTYPSPVGLRWNVEETLV
ncbi:MAG: hypothetical protein ACR2J8_00635, partial [Thermomicrobiales bacterium]